jgi:hypothetical protein
MAEQTIILTDSPEIVDNVIIDYVEQITIIISEAANGLSAYQLAVENGFVGTEAEWLASLQGSGGGGTVQAYAYTVPIGDVSTFTIPALIGKNVVVAFRQATPMYKVSGTPANINQLQFTPATAVFNLWAEATTTENELIIILYA